MVGACHKNALAVIIDELAVISCEAKESTESPNGSGAGSLKHCINFRRVGLEDFPKECNPNRQVVFEKINTLIS